MVDLKFLEFCGDDLLFYDWADHGGSGDDYRGACAPADGWTVEQGREWTVCVPPALNLPNQGWKIHVSAVPENAEKLLDAVVPYCVAHQIMFKYVKNEQTLARRGSKYADRTASGKFITIYPPDEASLERTLNDLDELIGGTPGPYILSDLRWKQGPLFVRYGGFVLRTTRNDKGQLVPAIEDPGGRLVPDVRRPSFRPPEWVTLPDCLSESLEMRKRTTMRDFPFRVHQALHFSNGGGVYRGIDKRSGQEVLLKEARPLAGFDNSGADAVARMEREHWALSRLAGLPWVPSLVDYRVGHEHRFLAREFVDGEPLVDVLTRRHPFLSDKNTAEARAEFAAWARGIFDQVEKGIRAMHERGVVFGDLHPGNILLKPDGTIAFIDMETATAPDDHYRQAMGAVGFYAPRHLSGVEVDLYALAALRLMMFVPMPHIVPWGAGKVRDLIDVVIANYDLPAEFIADIERGLGPDVILPKPDFSVVWPSDPIDSDLRDRIADTILATATLERTDRLYPGDANQFVLPGGGVTFAYGAAGVLWALSQSGHEPPAEHVQWLVDRCDGLETAGPGFFSGLAGVAFALESLGRHDEATSVLDAAVALPPDRVNDSLMDGWSGLGLTVLHFATTRQDPTYLSLGREIAERIGAKMRSGATGPTPRGLLYGGTGQALFLLRLFQHTKEPAFLDAAARELRAEISALDAEASGGPRRTVASGLAGIGGMALVTHALLRALPDDDLRDAHRRLVSEVQTQFAVSNGLFKGRSGGLLALIGDESEPGTSAAVRANLDALRWEAVSTEPGNVLFIGDPGYRLSTDLATGSAGVLIALEAVARRAGPQLPFLSDPAGVSAG